MPKKDEQTEQWTECVEETMQLPVGESTFEIVGEPEIYEGDYGKKLAIPTNLGLWRIGVRSPVARKLKEANNELGHIAHITLTVVRTGEKAETRYDVKKMILPQQRQHTPPPKNQFMLNLDNLTPEQQAQVDRLKAMLKEPATDTT